MENGSLDELPRVGFSIGEPGGIGPQLLLSFLEREGWQEHFIPIVFAHRRVIERWRSFLGLSSLRYHAIRHIKNAQPQHINLLECTEGGEFTIGHRSEVGGRIARAALQEGVRAASAGEIDLLVTLPVDKSTFYSEKTFPYRGHTAYFRAIFPQANILMMMIGEKLRVGLLTEHVPLCEVKAHLVTEKVKEVLRIFHSSLVMDFAIPTPRIGVLGLNPHAGDGGVIGNEELELLAPAIEALTQEGMMIGGPFSPDGFFASHQYEKVDGVLAMYHDQGLIPFKLLAGWEGFQFTAGLDFVRTAPDHGVAYDIVGKEEADISSLSAAIWEGLGILRRRKNWKEIAHPPS
ncbi:MAG: 4-hydroxythreonine-4-phosphate dehydrogenase PdxA [Bacteroidia bacterium]|nr:4-hydroxythreonine-4-phosphate dehydrogenase PdxA [Bacteroidia bacterium]MDW8134661.1 4-hydroxythreonine-4-phosphate dehydrogenase PdxA [Bacteroidia bacterium]